jgi:hypothetical protein
MKRIRTFLVLALVAVPAAPVFAAAPAAGGPVTVARYTFDAGASTTGIIAENSGRGLPLKVRKTGTAALRFGPRSTGKYIAFPARCAANATTCNRLILEGGDDPDLDPGTRPFRWGATIAAFPGQVGQSANVMQKGMASTESQWKLQIGGLQPRAQCVIIGVGSTKAYIARSTITITDGKWHQVTCLRHAKGLVIIIDGLTRGAVAVPATVSVANALPLRIGGGNLQATSDMYNGAIDDVFAAVG